MKCIILYQTKIYGFAVHIFKLNYMLTFFVNTCIFGQYFFLNLLTGPVHPRGPGLVCLVVAQEGSTSKVYKLRRDWSSIDRQSHFFAFDYSNRNLNQDQSLLSPILHFLVLVFLFELKSQD